MRMIRPEIVRCQFHGKTFYVDRTNGVTPVSLKCHPVNGERRLCVDEDGSEDCFFLFVTDRCNLACPFCFETEKSGFSESAEPWYSVEQLVEFFRDTSVKKAQIWFFGGEPLLGDDWIVSCIEGLESAGINCSYTIATNLTLLKESMRAYSRNRAIRYLVNLDACLCVPSAGKYLDDVLDNVSRLSRDGIEVMGMSVWSPNCKVSIHQMMEAFVSRGMRYFDVNIAHCFKYSEEDVREFAAQLETFADWYISNILSHDLRYAWVQPFSKYIRSLLFPEEPLHQVACGAGKQLAAIATDGTLYPCQVLVGREGCSSGSVLQKRWDRPYEGINDDTVPACAACDLKYSCKGRCVANNVIMEGSACEPEASRCQMEHVVFACSAYIVGELQHHPVELAVLRKAFSYGRGAEVSAH